MSIVICSRRDACEKSWCLHASCHKHKRSGGISSCDAECEEIEGARCLSEQDVIEESIERRGW